MDIPHQLAPIYSYFPTSWMQGHQPNTPAFFISTPHPLLPDLSLSITTKPIFWSQSPSWEITLSPVPVLSSPPLEGRVADWVSLEPGVLTANNLLSHPPHLRIQSIPYLWIPSWGKINPLEDDATQRNESREETKGHLQLVPLQMCTGSQKRKGRIWGGKIVRQINVFDAHWKRMSRDRNTTCATLNYKPWLHSHSWLKCHHYLDSNRCNW